MPTENPKKRIVRSKSQSRIYIQDLKISLDNYDDAIDLLQINPIDGSYLRNIDDVSNSADLATLIENGFVELEFETGFIIDSSNYENYNNYLLLTTDFDLSLDGSDPGSTNFLDLTDTPNSYAGQEGKIIGVNATADGLEFIDSGTPGAHSHAASDITTGTFGTGDYTFNGKVTVNQNAADSKSIYLYNTGTGTNIYSVFGLANSNATNKYGVYGQSVGTGTNYGVYGFGSTYGVYGSGTTAGYFLGNAVVSGTLTIGTLASGSTDSVIINDGNILKIRTIDTRVWGSTLVDVSGTPSQYQIAYFNDANTLISNSNLTFNGNILTVTGAVSATNSGASGTALYGLTSGTGTKYGVYGQSINATTNTGVYGLASGGTTNYGVYGQANDGTSYAGYFVGNVTAIGIIAGTTITGANVTSGSDPGHTHTAYASSSHNHAASDITTGTFGTGDYTFNGKVTVNQSTADSQAIYATNTGTGTNIYSVFGLANSNATNKYGVYGQSVGTGTNYGVYGFGSTYGVYGSGTTAGYFLGNAVVTGTLTVSSLASDTTDTVIIHNSNVLKTRTIDSRVWGSTLVDYSGSNVNTQISYFTDTDTITSSSGLTWGSSTLTVTGSTSVSNSSAGGTAIFGLTTGTGTKYGVYGQSINATTNTGVYGLASGGTTNYGVYGQANDGTSYAGYFVGNVTAIGTIAGTTITGANVTSGSDPGHTHTAYQTTLTISTGLTNAAGTITVDLSTGKSGGLTVTGGTGAGDDLTFSTTTDGTKGSYIFSDLASAASPDATDRILLINTSGVLKSLANGSNGYYLKLNSSTGIIEWNSVTAGSSTFLDLTDAPDAYTNQGGKLVRVNAAPDGLEFVDGATLFAALSHTHAASDITTGTFGTGDYTFNGKVTVNQNTSDSQAVYSNNTGAGTSIYSVFGLSNSSATNKYGVYGQSIGTGTNYGIYGLASGGTTNYGVYGVGTTSGYFLGNVTITGTTTLATSMTGLIKSANGVVSSLTNGSEGSYLTITSGVPTWTAVQSPPQTTYDEIVYLGQPFYWFSPGLTLTTMDVSYLGRPFVFA